MIRSFIFILKVLVIAAATLWIIEHSGPVSATWNMRGQTYVVETTTAWLLLGLGLTVLSAWLMGRLWQSLRSLGIRRRARRWKKGTEMLAQAYGFLWADDMETSRRLAHRADKLLNNPSVTLLLKAELARRDGQTVEAHGLYSRMLEDIRWKPVALKGLLMHFQDNPKAPEALALAQQFQASLPKNKTAVMDLFNTQIAQKDWMGAEKTLSSMQRLHMMTAENMSLSRAVIWLEMGHQAYEKGKETWAMRLGKKAHLFQPSHVPTALFYARLLVSRGRISKALKALEKTWRLAPHPDIARLHATIGVDRNPLKKVKYAERLLTLAADSPEAHLALAEASFEASLWGEARHHAQKVIETAPSATVYRLLAAVEEAEKPSSGKALAWLEKASLAPSGPTWICDACGTTSDQWQSTCGHCRSFNTIAWGTPRVALTPVSVIESEKTAS